MRVRYSLLLPIACALLPFAASAQSDDAAYCAALSALATRYVAPSRDQGSAADVELNAAIDQCGGANRAAGIAVLERKLRNNGFTLPKR
jgi:hypothetical protein